MAQRYLGCCNRCLTSNMTRFFGLVAVYLGSLADDRGGCVLSLLALQPVQKLPPHCQTVHTA